ncbi:MAG: ATP-binding cassette domain-containing protein [Bacteroidota bacterium]
MPVLTLHDVSLSLGGPRLLDRTGLVLDDGERVCLVGRNGTGKSTLLRMIAGQVAPDEGEVRLRSGARVAYLTQAAPEAPGQSVFDVIAEGLPEGFDRHANAHRVEALCSQMDLDPQARYDDGSGGMRRRARLARALVAEPDLLLLDEPTNHLDLDAITWLEGFLQRWGGTLLFVTHDRAFLRALATRIVELDRGALKSFPGNYYTFLQRRDELLEIEAREQAQFDKKLAEEEAWIRRGIKARRTRNEGRVRALKAMRDERAARRETVGDVQAEISTASRSGKRVIVAQGIAYAWPEAEGPGIENGASPVVRDFSTTIQRGDKVGLIGPNGAGKTTLLRLLLGTLEPESGTVTHGTNLEVAYFDQHRDVLDDTMTVEQAVTDGMTDTVQVNGQPVHVMSYLKRFLFDPKRARESVGVLSGGERARLLLARLFARPSNVLVLDEPTNDLDLETLDLLEDLLGEYPGTVLLVSHDRAFLDNVVSSTFALEGDGVVNEYVGGYADWKRQKQRQTEPVSPKPKAKSAPAASNGKPRSGKTKLSYKEQRELDALPGQIEALEAEQAEIHTAMAQPDFHTQGPDAYETTQKRLNELAAELETAYERWDELETLRAELEAARA